MVTFGPLGLHSGRPWELSVLLGSILGGLGSSLEAKGVLTGCQVGHFGDSLVTFVGNLESYQMH